MTPMLCYGCRTELHAEHLAPVELHLAGRPRLVEMCLGCLLANRGRAVDSVDAARWAAELLLIAAAEPTADATPRELELHADTCLGLRDRSTRAAWVEVLVRAYGTPSVTD